MKDDRIGVVVLAWAMAMAVVGGCASTSGIVAQAPAPGLSATPVSQVGQMRAVMREGLTEPRAALTEFVGTPHAFAVGAMAGLDGEVTILDGQVWITRVVAGRPVSFGPHATPDDNATLLIGAHVSAWRSVTLPAAAGGEELEALIAQQARAHGLDASKPFPFRIEGGLSSLDMHVINGFCPHSGGEAAQANQPWTFAGAPAAHVTIVGFYAGGSEGEMTHHGTAIHAHALVRLDAERITGHVDAMTVAPGAVLMLPAWSQ
jgi:acetolactate decarboxylase